jgi:hypothetical protein
MALGQLAGPESDPTSGIVGNGFVTSIHDNHSKPAKPGATAEWSWPSRDGAVSVSAL